MLLIRYTLDQALPVSPRLTRVPQVDGRIGHVLGVVCSRHGPHELRLPPLFGAPAALYRRLLWVHSHDAGVCRQGKPFLSSPQPVPSHVFRLACFSMSMANSPPQLHSTILTMLSALVQIACLVWYLVSYFPMGSAGLRLATSFGARQATSWMSG